MLVLTSPALPYLFRILHVDGSYLSAYFLHSTAVCKDQNKKTKTFEKISIGTFKKDVLLVRKLRWIHFHVNSFKGRKTIKSLEEIAILCVSKFFFSPLAIQTVRSTVVLRFFVQIKPLCFSKMQIQSRITNTNIIFEKNVFSHLIAERLFVHSRASMIYGENHVVLGAPWLQSWHGLLY